MLIAGVDEVGRGPLAGAVVTAAVILPEEHSIHGLADSKKLSEKKRNQLFSIIQEQAIDFAYGRCEREEIDELNILQATFKAMQRAVAGLKIKPEKVLVDGNHAPDFGIPAESIIQGDGLIECISAASILAKVTRDSEMLEYEEQYPGYGFAKHKGYPTKQHLEALDKLGITPIHRRSFSPVAKRLK